MICTGRLAPIVSALALISALTTPIAVQANLSSPTERTSPSQLSLRAGQVQIRLVTGGLSSPVFVGNADDGTGRLFVVEQGGKVRVVVGGVLQSTAFLDIRTKVTSGSERGLLGLAFHPSFASNRKLYVDYTRVSDGDIVIAEYTAASNGQTVNPSTERILLTIDHSTYANHNGGMLAFGPDGYLYIATGDGGGGGDPLGSGQNTYSLLGKILRIDISGTGNGKQYLIPAGNPFASSGGAPEVWSYGLRNPWRFSFDRSTGTMWVGDVGQGSWEEVDREPSGIGGRNYGWNVMEGSHCYSPSSGCDTSRKTLPIAEYSHSYGCAITGGYVYGGSAFPDLSGQYVYGDYCSGNLWTIPAGGSSPTFHGNLSVNPSSFGEAENGELYLTDLNGGLYQVVAAPFGDIADSPFFNDILWLADSGITSGCSPTRFCPKATVTREQMAAFIDRAMGLPATSTDFFDDDDGSAFEASINRVAAAGIAAGCGTRRFCPDDPVSRGQMAAFLDRALHLPPTSTDFFTDDENLVYEASINRVAAAGITRGCTATTYCPKLSITREQMAAFLHRAFG